MPVFPTFLRNYLLVTGGLASLVFAVPGIVLIAFFFLIIPGLILSVMPVAFAYGCLFAAIRFGLVSQPLSVLARTTPARINMLAAMGVVVPVVLFPALSQAEAHWRLNRFKLTSVTPTTALAISGDVRFERQFDHKECQSDCRALLRRPGVRSVTVNEPPVGDFAALRDGKSVPEGRTFRLRVDRECMADGALMSDALAATCFIEGPTPAIYDVLIREGEWRQWPDASSYNALRRPISARFAEVRMPSGVYARVWEENTQALGIPLSAYPSCGGTYGTQMCWWRTNLGVRPNGTYPTALTLIKDSK